MCIIMICLHVHNYNNVYLSTGSYSSARGNYNLQNIFTCVTCSIGAIHVHTPVAVESNQHSLSNISLKLHVYHEQHDTIQEQCFTLSKGGGGGGGGGGRGGGKG